MSDEAEIPNQRIIQVGPDRVTITEQEVVIEAKYEMPEWEVRGLMRPPSIYFEDKRYLLTVREPLEGPFAFRYVLRPWPPGKESNPNMFYDYNLETVKERDAERLGEMTNNIYWVLLLPVYPLLGLCWSGQQNRLVRLGYVPRSLTGISIFASVCLVLVQGVMACVLFNGSLRSGKLMVGGMFTAFVGHNFVSLGGLDFPVGIVDGFIMVSLAVDAAVRYTQYLREDQWIGGYLEWLKPKPPSPPEK